MNTIIIITVKQAAELHVGGNRNKGISFAWPKVIIFYCMFNAMILSWPVEPYVSECICIFLGNRKNFASVITRLPDLLRYPCTYTHTTPHTFAYLYVDPTHYSYGCVKSTSEYKYNKHLGTR